MSCTRACFVVVARLATSLALDSYRRRLYSPCHWNSCRGLLSTGACAFEPAPPHPIPLSHGHQVGWESQQDGWLSTLASTKQVVYTQYLHTIWGESFRCRWHDGTRPPSRTIGLHVHYWWQSLFPTLLPSSLSRWRRKGRIHCTPLSLLCFPHSRLW